MGVTLTSEMINGAQKAQAQYGVPASVTLAQIMLESGGNYPGGMSGLAYKDNNLFGIKAGSSWNGKTVSYKTTEYANGKYYTDTASFRKYDSVADSIEDHAKVLSQPIYTNKTKNATNLTEYVKAMGSVYATSPTYAQNVMSIIKSNNLTKYDGSMAYDPTTMMNIRNGNLSNVKTPNASFNNPSKGQALTVTSSGSSGGSSGGSTDGATLAYDVGNVSIGGVIGEALGVDKFLSNIIRIVVVLILIILAVIALLNAFGFSAKDVGQNVVHKVVKKKTGVDTKKISEAVEVKKDG